MNYHTFQREICAQVQQILGQRAEVVITYVRKNNDVQKKMLTFRGEGTGVAPVIYMDDLYACYQNGYTIEMLAMQIMLVYKKSMDMGQPEVKEFSDYEQAKQHIYYRLINREKNREFLENVPYLPFLDLALVCYYQIPEGPFAKATITLQNENLEFWKVESDALIAHAWQNTLCQKAAVLRGMNDFLGHPGEEAMYILSNEENCFGAACLLYPDILRDVGELLACNYYILPSSVHECILVPDTGEFDRNGLQEMVQHINQTHLEATEVLSDQVYYFDRKEGKARVL